MYREWLFQNDGQKDKLRVKNEILEVISELYFQTQSQAITYIIQTTYLQKNK